MSADIPGALQALQVGRDPSPGPAQSHVLSATLDLALPLARHALCIRRARLGLWDPCPRQGPSGGGGSGGRCRIPRKQRPLQLRPLMKSLHFFPNGSSAFESVSVHEGREEAIPQRKASQAVSHT